MSFNCVTVGSEGRLGPVKINMELNMATTVPADLDLVAPNGDYPSIGTVMIYYKLWWSTLSKDSENQNTQICSKGNRQ